MTTELEEARATACRLMLEATRYRDALDCIANLGDHQHNRIAAHLADIVLMGYDISSEMSEEEALEHGMQSCAVCEEWGTVPGSTRCQDCQEDEA
jgi:hypothetical protein